MREKIIFLSFLSKGLIKSGCQLIKVPVSTLRRIGDRTILTPEEGNSRLKTMIAGKGPFCAGRYGHTELLALTDALAVQLNLSRRMQSRVVRKLCRLSGFFPEDRQQALKFGMMMTDLSREADFMGCWNIRMEDYLLKYYAVNSTLAEFQALEPYFFNAPWSASLTGKHVLVIHPFARTIEKQYQRRERLFDNPAILPEFQLSTLKAVQSIARNQTSYASWFEALEDMYNKALQTDFDIAVIGCGAYGFPLAVKLKQAGRQAVHMGGATQILFGIKGRRWDNNPTVSRLYNQHWTRPLPEETPARHETIEGGCYW